MRLSMLVFFFLSAAALAHKASLMDGWIVEFSTTDGKFSREGIYDTREACEAAIPATLKAQNGYNGHCVHSNSKTGKLEGSQDPASNH